MNKKKQKNKTKLKESSHNETCSDFYDQTGDLILSS